MKYFFIRWEETGNCQHKAKQDGEYGIWFGEGAQVERTFLRPFRTALRPQARGNRHDHGNVEENRTSHSKDKIERSVYDTEQCKRRRSPDRIGWGTIFGADFGK